MQAYSPNADNSANKFEVIATTPDGKVFENRNSYKEALILARELMAQGHKQKNLEIYVCREWRCYPVY